MNFRQRLAVATESKYMEGLNMRKLHTGKVAGAMLGMLRIALADLSARNAMIDTREQWTCQVPRLLGTPCGMKNRGPRCMKCETARPC